MKKITGLFSLCAIALMVAPTALAADVAGNTNLETEGSITFGVSTNPGTGIITKPDETGTTPGEIELPDQGSNGSGALRLSFVPNFKFGSKTGITAAESVADVNVLKYNTPGNTATKIDIAPFVQVTDERGLIGADARWSVNVKATEFIANKGTGTEDTLSNVKILLAGSTLTMDYKTTAEAGNFIEGQGTNAEILTDDTTATTVLSTKAGQSTSGYQVSNIFHNNYKAADSYDQSKSKGVQFVKPAGQAPINGYEYKSTLKWTLTDGL